MIMYNMDIGGLDMDKIIRIENRIVSVGKTDGSLEEFDIAYFNFSPRIGDYVNIYRNDDSIIITKAESIFTNQTNGRGVNKVVYALLAFFLGVFGAKNSMQEIRVRVYFHLFSAGQVSQQSMEFINSSSRFLSRLMRMAILKCKAVFFECRFSV